MKSSIHRCSRGLCLLWLFAAGSWPASLTGQTRIAGKSEITVSVDSMAGVIDANLYGQFSEHLGTCIYGGLWVGEESSIPNTRGIRNDVVTALKKLQVPVLRWPGGCFADDYHWRDGIGPAAKRPRTVNLWWGKYTEDNSFGTHEFIGLCRLIGAEPGMIERRAGAGFEFRCDIGVAHDLDALARQAGDCGHILGHAPRNGHQTIGAPVEIAQLSPLPPAQERIAATRAPLRRFYRSRAQKIAGVTWTGDLDVQRNPIVLGLGRQHDRRTLTDDMVQQEVMARAPVAVGERMQPHARRQAIQIGRVCRSDHEIDPEALFGDAPGDVGHHALHAAVAEARQKQTDRA